MGGRTPPSLCPSSGPPARIPESDSLSQPPTATNTPPKPGGNFLGVVVPVGGRSNFFPHVYVFGDDRCSNNCLFQNLGVANFWCLPDFRRRWPVSHQTSWGRPPSFGSQSRSEERDAGVQHGAVGDFAFV